MRADWKEMKAGREMDIAAALAVMDYMWLKHMLQFSAELAVKWLGTQADIDEAGGVYRPVSSPEEFIALKERENHAESVPAYSTDGKAAQLVVSQLAQKGWEHQLSQQPDGSWLAQFTAKDKTAAGQGAAEAEAIVKAALAAAASE